MATLNELLKDLAQVDVEMAALCIRRYELLRQVRPLTIEGHRASIRGSLWAYVVRNYGGAALPRFGDRVRIIRSMEKSALVGWHRADVDFQADIPYSSLSLTKPEG